MGKGIFKNFRGLVAEFLLPALLVFFWVAGSRGYFRAEVAGIRKIPSLLSLDYNERKYSYDGPIQILSDEALQIIPEKSVIYFYNPAISGVAASYFYVKARYALYPRKVVNELKKFDTGAMLKSDYVMFIVPSNSGVAKVPALEKLPFLKKVFAYDDSEGFMAIYRVSK